MPTTSARVESRFPDGAREWCYLAMFGVDPMWQGKGLGSRLIQHKNKALKGTPMCVSTQSSRTVSTCTSTRTRPTTLRLLLLLSSLGVVLQPKCNRSPN